MKGDVRIIKAIDFDRYGNLDVDANDGTRAVVRVRVVANAIGTAFPPVVTVRDLLRVRP